MRIHKRRIGMLFLILTALSATLSLFQVIKLTTLQPNVPHSDIVFEATESASITIDIEGAVQSPGMYTLPSDARLYKAIQKAGGLHQKHDALRIAQQFNLSKKLHDEEKIYIPYQADENSNEEALHAISLSSASQTQLELLPGIGPVTAKKIIDNRPYSTIEELITKKVVSEKVFASIKDQVIP